MQIGWSMAQARSTLLMEMFIGVNIKTEDLMELVLINGTRKEHFIKEILKMVWDMVKESGKKGKLSITGVTCKDWNKVMDNSTSQVAIFTREIFSKIKKKGMEKCFGLIVVFTRVNGSMAYKAEKDRFTWQVVI